MSARRNSYELTAKPNSTLVSFVVHTVTGKHFGEQAVVACVNGETFVLYPRFKKPGIRVYERGYGVSGLLPPSEPIEFSVGVVTPEDESSGFLHGFAKHVVPARDEPLVKKLTLKTPGDVYVIEASLYVSPSTKRAGTPSWPARRTLTANS